MVDRAEPLQKNGLKPDSSFFKAIENVIVAWPTKLALAPKLAAEILAYLVTTSLVLQPAEMRALRSWPMPTVAQPIWEEGVFCSSDV